MSIVIDRIEYLKNHPDYEPKPGKFHYAAFKAMNDRKREAIESMVKGLASATLSTGENCLDIYKYEMTDDEKMSAESIVDDVLMEIAYAIHEEEARSKRPRNGYLVKKDGMILFKTRDIFSCFNETSSMS